MNNITQLSPKKPLKKAIVIATHAIGWGLFLMLPTLLSTSTEDNSHRFIHSLWLAAWMISVFYLNFFVLIPKFLFLQRIGYFILLNMCGLLVFLGGMHFFRQAYLIDFFPWIKKYSAGKYFFKDTLTFLLASGLSVAIKVTDRWYKTEASRKSLETEHLRSEVVHLKYQLQPHFFFNTLNNIYSLIDLSTDKAKEAIHRLSKLMRYLLYETDVERVPLEKEIGFLEDYIELMELRMNDQLALTKQLDIPENNAIAVPPLIFISLTENAFKHGISPTKKSFIDITLHVQQGHIVFIVSNSNFPKEATDQSGSGIGLENLKKRLELLYPERYQLNIDHDQTTHTVALSIKHEDS